MHKILQSSFISVFLTSINFAATLPSRKFDFHLSAPSSGSADNLATESGVKLILPIFQTRPSHTVDSLPFQFPCMPALAVLGREPIIQCCNYLAGRLFAELDYVQEGKNAERFEASLPTTA